MTRLRRSALLLAVAILALTASSASASDHVFTARQNGKPNFGASDPSCVPGSGDPKAGAARGTPAHSDASCRRNSR
jgi:hypothetical protein